jgi:hypothetical protein
MAQMVIATLALPDAPVEAAAHFYAEHVPMARDLLSGEAALPGLAEELDALAFVFPSAGKEHQGWRLAAIQALAREAAPKRVNGVIGDDRDAIDETTDWLAAAPGITGQLLSVQTG